MASETIIVQTPDGLDFEAYVSKPATSTAPAVIVIQEIFGINPWVRQIADWLAECGFLAVAPDLFHRLEPGLQLSDQNDADMKKAFALYGQFDENLGVKDIIATVAAAGKLPQCNGNVGAIGFCLGGKLAFLAATRAQVNASVGYYGVGIENNLSEPVKQNLMLHMAGSDSFVDKEAQSTIKKALANNPLVTIHTYEGQDHAFCRVGGAHYNKEAADLAHGRTLAFLKDKLSK